MPQAAPRRRQPAELLRRSTAGAREHISESWPSPTLLPRPFPLDTLSNPAARANMVSRRPMDHFARPARFTDHRPRDRDDVRSEEHTSELQSLMRISYAVFCLKKKTTSRNRTHCSPHNSKLTPTYTH